MPCRVPGCDNPVIYGGKQLCSLHYQRLHHTGTVAKQWYHPRVGLCSTAGCRHRVRNRGLCATHYGQWLRRQQTAREDGWWLWRRRQQHNLRTSTNKATRDDWSRWCANKVRIANDRILRKQRTIDCRRSTWGTWCKWAQHQCVVKAWKANRDEWQQWCEKKQSGTTQRCPHDYRIRVKATVRGSTIQMLFNWA